MLFQCLETGGGHGEDGRLAMVGFNEFRFRALENYPLKVIAENFVGFCEQSAAFGKRGGKIASHADGLRALTGA